MDNEKRLGVNVKMGIRDVVRKVIERQHMSPNVPCIRSSRGKFHKKCVVNPVMHN